MIRTYITTDLCTMLLTKSSSYLKGPKSFFSLGMTYKLKRYTSSSILTELLSSIANLSFRSRNNLIE